MDDDDKKAIEIFRAAAEQGRPVPQYQLVSMLLVGQGVDEPDRKEATYWFRKAAEAGFVMSKAN